MNNTWSVNFLGLSTLSNFNYRVSEWETVVQNPVTTMGTPRKILYTAVFPCCSLVVKQRKGSLCLFGSGTEPQKAIEGRLIGVSGGT